MRRLLTILFALSAVATGTSLAAGPTAARAQVPPDDARRGLVYAGLQRAGSGFCAGAFEATVRDRLARRGLDAVCTHGPDPAPEGVDVRQRREPEPQASGALATPGAAGAAAATGAVGCFGTGSDGFRVQLIYARSSSSTDRYASYASSFLAWAQNVDNVVDNSAAETGGGRRVRFVTDGSCRPVVDRVTLTSSGAKNFDGTVSDLRAKGYNRTDRRYIVWVDANVYCGIAQVYTDDRADPTPGVNYSNGHPQVPGAVGRIDNGCWGRADPVEAHELMHTIGGVQPSAPHATPGFHCTDESDRLCYADGSVSAAAIQQVCSGHEALYDCNHDDYFSTAPAPGSYLATHWNSANSAFLAAASPAPGPAPPPTTTTTTTRPPATTVPPTTAPPTTSPPTTSPPATSPPATSPPTTSPPAAPPPSGSPSAPQGLTASQPTGGTGVTLSWLPPGSGGVTGYQVSRGTTPYNLSFLAAIGNVTGYADTAAATGSFYFYSVTAVNDGAESPPSNITGMVAR